MSIKVAAAVLIVIAFFVGRSTAPEPDTHRAETRRAPGPSVAQVRQAKADLATVQAQLDSEQAARVRAEQQLADLRERVAAPEPDKAATTPAKPAGPRFRFDGFNKALDKVDWEAVGDSLAHMPPLLSEFAEAALAGKPLPASVGEIQRWNGPLVTQALTLAQNGVPGTGINGSFTHPSALVNMIYVTLDRANVGLDETQANQLAAIGTRYLEQDSARLSEYGDSTLAFAKLIDEAAMKDAFFAEVRSIMQEDQRKVLWPKKTAGLTSVDLFSTGVLWGPTSTPVEFSSREDLETKLATIIVARLGLAQTDRPVLDGLVREWSSALSDEFLTVPVTTAVKSYRMMDVARIRAVAPLELNLLVRMLAQLQLSDSQQKRIRSSTLVFVPYRTSE